MSNIRSIRDIVALLSASHAAVISKGDERKAANAGMNKAKMHVYANFIAAIAEIGELDGGGLTKKQSGLMQQGLLAAGISDACVTRYSANSNGAFKASKELRDAAESGASSVLAWFKANKIDTETKIRALHVAPVDALKILARKVADLNEEDYATLVVQVAEMKGLEATQKPAADSSSPPSGDIVRLAGRSRPH